MRISRRQFSTKRLKQSTRRRLRMRGGLAPLAPMVIEGMTSSPSPAAAATSSSTDTSTATTATTAATTTANLGLTQTQTKPTNLAVNPVRMTEDEAGGPQKAYQATVERAERQAVVNKTLKGGSRHRSRRLTRSRYTRSRYTRRTHHRRLRRYRRKLRLFGGVAPLNPAPVSQPLVSPQFPGGAGPQSATATAYLINQTMLNSQAQSTNDKLVK
jgi:hypothetical protein